MLAWEKHLKLNQLTSGDPLNLNPLVWLGAFFFGDGEVVCGLTPTLP